MGRLLATLKNYWELFTAAAIVLVMWGGISVRLSNVEASQQKFEEKTEQAQNAQEETRRLLIQIDGKLDVTNNEVKHIKEQVDKVERRVK